MAGSVVILQGSWFGCLVALTKSHHFHKHFVLFFFKAQLLNQYLVSSILSAQTGLELTSPRLALSSSGVKEASLYTWLNLINFEYVFNMACMSFDHKISLGNPCKLLY